MNTYKKRENNSGNKSTNKKVNYPKLLGRCSEPNIYNWEKELITPNIYSECGRKNKHYKQESKTCMIDSKTTN